MVSLPKDFSENFIKALGLHGGEVKQKILEEFISKYFTDEEKIKILDIIQKDTDMFRGLDPASKNYSSTEILSVRRGMAAICAHRIFSVLLENNANYLYELEILAKQVQKDTNVEIHPSAQIHEKFAIDHGHGTVIGATVIIEQNVWLYHGVTLGSTGKCTPSGRRHPKISSGCYLGNGSQVLGPSILGKSVSIGAGSIIADSSLGDNTSVYIGVKISGVCIPANMKIYGSDPENPFRYWATQENETNASWKEFPKFTSWQNPHSKNSDDNSKCLPEI